MPILLHSGAIHQAQRTLGMTREILVALGAGQMQQTKVVWICVTVEHIPEIAQMANRSLKGLQKTLAFLLNYYYLTVMRVWVAKVEDA